MQDHNTTNLGASLKFEVEQLTNHPTFELTLTAEIITTKTGDKLVLFMPSDVARKLISPVPYSCQDLDYLSLPSRPVIVLGESLTADYSGYAGTEFKCSVGNAEYWHSEMVIFYRAPVTSADIEAFNQQNGTTPTTGHMWEELGKTHVLIGGDVREPTTLLGNILRKIRRDHFIIGFAVVAAVAAVVLPVLAYQQYDSIGSVSTAFIHTPLALFGAVAAVVTLKIDKRFSVIAVCFALLNAGLI